MGGSPVFSKKKTMVVYNKYSELERNAVIDVINRGTLSSFRGGQEVKQFEKEFANYIHCKYALTTTSGTTALHTAIASLCLPKGSEILVPALTFVSTASVVIQEGLIPVFVDVDKHFCLDPCDLLKKITPKSRAIIPVHLYGHPAQMDKIMAIAHIHNLFVIEDACQSHGATYRGQKTGTIGDIGCFSFYETKNMSCGEGGMITCSNDELFAELCLIKEHGSPRAAKTWYQYERLGYNYSMTELQAAIGRVQLRRLDENNNNRRKNAAYYREVLSGLNIELPKHADDVDCVYHNFPVLLPAALGTYRDFIVDALRAEGVPIDIAYPQPLYRTQLFKEMHITANCPYVENVTSRLFTLFTDGAIDNETIELTGIALKKVLTFLHG